jgi:hypothetical protein
MGTYNFREDLLLSAKSIQKVVQFLAMCQATDIQFCDNHQYDIKFNIDSQSYTLEVKEDLLWSQTGKVAIEYHSRGKPSGIQTSKADVWVYVLGGELYFCKTDKLRKAIAENGYLRRIGGDDKSSLLILLTLYEFKKLFHKNYLSL